MHGNTNLKPVWDTFVYFHLFCFVLFFFNYFYPQLTKEKEIEMLRIEMTFSQSLKMPMVTMLVA